MENVILAVMQNGVDLSTNGNRDGYRNAEMLDCAYAAQDGLCWLCRQSLGTDAELDRLVPGRDLHNNCSASCSKTNRCRCGYLPGNVAAAHRYCNNVIRKTLTNDALAALIRYAPTADEMAAAKRHALGMRRAAERQVALLVSDAASLATR